MLLHLHVKENVRSANDVEKPLLRGKLKSKHRKSNEYTFYLLLDINKTENNLLAARLYYLLQTVTELLEARPPKSLFLRHRCWKRPKFELLKFLSITPIFQDQFSKKVKDKTLHVPLRALSALKRNISRRKVCPQSRKFLTPLSFGIGRWGCQNCFRRRFFQYKWAGSCTEGRFSELHTNNNETARTTYPWTSYQNCDYVTERPANSNM